MSLSHLRRVATIVAAAAAAADDADSVGCAASVGAVVADKQSFDWNWM